MLRKLGVECSEGALVYHRMGVVIAEVAQATNQRADERIADARAIATEMERLSESAQALMEGWVAPTSMSGPQAAAMLRICNRLTKSLETFKRSFRWFRREHGPLLESEATEAIERFLEWFPGHCAEVAQRVKRFESSVANDLENNADRDAGLVRKWGQLDSDPAV